MVMCILACGGWLRAPAPAPCPFACASVYLSTCQPVHPCATRRADGAGDGRCPPLCYGPSRAVRFQGVVRRCLCGCHAAFSSLCPQMGSNPLAGQPRPRCCDAAVSRARSRCPLDACAVADLDHVRAHFQAHLGDAAEDGQIAFEMARLARTEQRRSRGIQEGQCDCAKRARRRR
eukprot:2689259-Pleurochrysis_carterae.AAC.2